MSRIRLLDRVRHAMGVRQYSMATEKAYMAWIRRYILFLGKRHPAEMVKLEIEAFLSHLAVNRTVSECLRPRVGDLDFSRHTIRVQAGKGTASGSKWNRQQLIHRRFIFTIPRVRYEKTVLGNCSRYGST